MVLLRELILKYLIFGSCKTDSQDSIKNPIKSEMDNEYDKVQKHCLPSEITELYPAFQVDENKN